MAADRVIITIEIQFDDGTSRTGEVLLDLTEPHGIPPSGSVRVSVAGPSEGATGTGEVRRAVANRIDEYLHGEVPATDLDAAIDDTIAKAFGVRTLGEATDVQRRHFEAFEASPLRDAALAALAPFLEHAGSSLTRANLGKEWGVTVGTGGIGSLTVNVGRAAVFWVDTKRQAYFFIEGDPPAPLPPFVAETREGLRLRASWCAVVPLERLDDALGDPSFRAAVEQWIEAFLPTHLQSNWHNPLTESLGVFDS